MHLNDKTSKLCHFESQRGEEKALLSIHNHPTCTLLVQWLTHRQIPAVSMSGEYYNSHW